MGISAETTTIDYGNFPSSHDARALNPERLPRHREHKRAGTLADSSRDANIAWPGHQAMAKARAEPLTADPESLPLEERILYYRSKIHELKPTESFRQEVLHEVYGYLLAKSLAQQKTA